jgi:hypothetical protein
MLNLPHWKADRSHLQGGVMRKQLYQRGQRKVWYADCQYMGVRIRDCLNTTDETFAQERLAELKILVRKGEYQLWKKLFVDCAKEYLENILPGKSKHCQVRYESVVRCHLMPFFGEHRIVNILHVNDVGESMVLRFFKERENLPLSSFKKIGTPLRDIIRQVDKNFDIPVALCKNKGFYQTRFLTEQELNVVIGNMDDQYQAIALIMAYTGFSLGDALGIRWRLVNLNDQMIRIIRGKTKDSSGMLINMPICNALYDLLRYRHRVRNLHDDRIFKIGRQGFQKAWRRAVNLARLDWRPRPTDLRHFFASYLLNQGEDHLVVANLLGHSSVEMLRKRYGHYSDERLKKAVNVFNGI